MERVRTELELRRGRSVAGVAGGGEAREGERETNVDERRGAAHLGPFWIQFESNPPHFKLIGILLCNAERNTRLPT